jgi:hypothetical protein
MPGRIVAPSTAVSPKARPPAARCRLVLVATEFAHTTYPRRARVEDRHGGGVAPFCGA